MEWSVSEWNAPFLDMWVYIDGKGSLNPSIQWHPYCKALNHHERIPFVTNHPKDVKKGAFISEMSRLAMLSSKHSHYQSALLELQLMYEARGYPTTLVTRWISDHAQKRWENRLAPSRKELQRESPVPLLVVKTEFNPVWDQFNVHELMTTIRNTWLTEIHKETWCDMDVFCSLHNERTIPIPPEIKHNALIRYRRHGIQHVWENDPDILQAGRPADIDIPDIPANQTAPVGSQNNLVQRDLHRFWDKTQNSVSQGRKKARSPSSSPPRDFGLGALQPPLSQPEVGPSRPRKPIGLGRTLPRDGDDQHVGS